MKRLVLALTTLAVLVLLVSLSTARAAEEAIVDAPKPESLLGRTFVFQETDLKSGKVIATFNYTFEKMGIYEKKQAFWIKVFVKTNSAEKTGYVVWDLELNYLAAFINERETESAQPSVKFFNWPLVVGKKWISRYDFWYKGEWQRGVIKEMKVEGFEKVTVPAGTFQASKVKMSDPYGGEGTIRYYAPDVMMIVKMNIENKRVQELIDIR